MNIYIYMGKIYIWEKKLLTYWINYSFQKIRQFQEFERIITLNKNLQQEDTNREGESQNSNVRITKRSERIPIQISRE